MKSFFIGRQGGFRFFSLLLLIVVTACQVQRHFKVEPLPRYDVVFERSLGWTGGDGAHSIALDDVRVLWLFGDTLIGRVEDGRRVDTHLINNSAAILTGHLPFDATATFFYSKRADGRPEALLRPADGHGWLWPYHGVRTPEGLFLFLLQVEPAEGPAGFGFKLVSTWLGKVANPDEAPDHWTLEQQKLPWGQEGRWYGAAVMVRGDTCYIYGTADDVSSGGMAKHLLLARAPMGSLGQISSWRFFANGDWVADQERAGRVCENVASEFSVSYQPELDGYVLVYSDGSLSPNIALRFSARPEGPWSDPVWGYRCPEADRDPRIFCYAAKGHPERAVTSEGLVVTYLTNATDFGLLESDARLYRPRFLRIVFE
jgi:hypothetical protein